MGNRRRANTLVSAVRHTLLAVTLVISADPGHLLAQARTVVPFETVRLTLRADDSVVQGMVTTIHPPDLTVRLHDGQSWVIRTDSILSAEVLTQHRRTGRGALIGGLAGASVGTLLWLVLRDDDNCDDEGIGLCDAFLNPVNDHIGKWLAISSTGGGVMLGALIGSRVVSDRWVPAMIPRLSVGIRR
jgi:hypothetical protein